MSATDAAPTRETVLFEAGSPLLDPSEATFRTGLVVVSLALVSGLATYLILTGLTPITPKNEVVIITLLVNVVMIVAMIIVIARQFAGLMRAWRERIAGARLHTRIVALFSIIAALPAMLLAVAATTTFSRSLDTWFSKRSIAIIESSLDVAKAYIEEHGQVIRTDTVNMARDLDAAAETVRDNKEELERLLIAQAGLRDLPAAYIIDEGGQPVVTAIEDKNLPYLAPPEEVVRQAKGGQVPLILPGARAPRVAAVAALTAYPGRLLYVARGVDPKVVRHVQRTEAGAEEFTQLRRKRGGLKVAHALMYLTISMTALLAAIWVGMWFAGRFAAPIRRLIAGAQLVSQGNLDVQLPERRGEGDLRRLSATFNKMTREIKGQRDALVTANEQLQERRRFMEAVLKGVSAGVIGLDAAGRVKLVSGSAQELLDRTADQLVGRKLSEAVPAFGEVLEQGQETGLKPRSQEQIKMLVADEERTFAVRFTHEQAGSLDVGMVVTFDDITELVSAQRTSAWADVARRIAHEIKNPLTPIQLSAERLKRKYGGSIQNDRETFDKLTDTIVRQVGDIKSMVDEFASFARLPKPVMEPGDLRHAVQEPVILFRESHTQIAYDIVLPRDPVLGSFDRRLITQAVTNLVKNATEAVEAAAESGERPADWKGRVETVLRVEDRRLLIEVIDNGQGLPKQNRSRLLEPYVTTKGHKGTGLGLAMVQKITEQHGGTLTLEDAPPAPDRPCGALVRITLPAGRKAQSESAA